MLAVAIAFTNITPLSAKTGSYEIKENLSPSDFEKMTDAELNERIEKSAQAFQDLMDSGAVILDANGFVSFINVDKLEEKFGKTNESSELRKIMNEQQKNAKTRVPSKRSARKHIVNFSNCFAKQLLKDFGIYQIRNAIHRSTIELLGRKKYFQFVQKVAQIAVNKLGKKVAVKIVTAATPAGWAINAWKASLWSYRCTVEYGRWS